MLPIIIAAKVGIKSFRFAHAITSYVASYNELEQLHMLVLLNCHLTTFLYSPFKFKKQPNDSLKTLACVIAIVYFS